MLLLLKPIDAQSKSLDKLLEAQQTPGDLQFHKFLTPREFAAKFQPSASDRTAVAMWLKSQGLEVAPLPASRGWIEFSGSVAQIERAFKTTVVSSGTDRYRLGAAIAIPRALASTVAGLASLDGSLAASATMPAVEVHPTDVEAAALAKHFVPATGSQGKGESIAIPSRSNVQAEDIAAFRKALSLSENAIIAHPSGPDPGITEESAATTLAVSWASAAAPEAQIVLIPAATTNATDGLDLALAATIDGALANTVSVGYSLCESAMSPTRRDLYAALYRQAAAEGIAIIAATGDSGAAACHTAGDSAPVSSGFAVNALASTPWNLAVGAVPASSSSGEAYATGGGASALWPTPKWQSAQGLPASDPGAEETTHHRYLPDISIPSTLQPDAAFCFAGSTATRTCQWMQSGGSAAAAAIVSGLAAILAEKYGPQGSVAPRFYALAQLQKSASKPPVEDIVAGDARLRCEAGSPDCDDTNQIGFEATVGYDLATGLGSINAAELIAAWATPAATGTEKVSVEMTNAGGVTYNPSAKITLTAKVTSLSGSAVPTGTVQFFDETTSQDTGTPVTLAADGTASYTETGQFTVGGHNIQAIYSGDSTYAAAESQPITINIQPSPTTLDVTPSTISPAGGSTITVTGVVTSSNLGASPPTGTLTVNLDGLPQGTATLATVAGKTSASVTVTVPAGGSHTVQGTYSGDINYNEATSSSVTITVAKSATTTAVAATPATLTAGTPESFTATVAPADVTDTTAVITGTVSFYDASTLIGTATLVGNTAVLASVTLSPSKAHTITAVFSGDTTFAASTSTPLILEPVLLPVTVGLTSSSAVLAPGQTATLVATVTPVTLPAVTAEQNPTGTVSFYAGTTLIGAAALVTSTGDSSTATLIVPKLPAGQYVLTAIYAGDLTYGPGTSNTLAFAVEDFTITCNPNSLTIVQGQTGQASCTVISSGGLTGPIQVLCTEQDPPQVGAIDCFFPAPSLVDGTGTLLLTVTTTAGNQARNQLLRRPGQPSGQPSSQPPGPWPAAAGGVALAFAGLLLSPIGRRARIFRSAASRAGLAMVLLIGLACANIGCSNTTNVRISTGTPLGIATLQISAAAFVNTVTVTHSTFITVNVIP